MTDELVSVEDHRDRILAAIEPLPAFDQPLMEAFGLAAAEDVHASVALPGFDNSAMDGYAVAYADVASASEESPVHLPVVGDVELEAGSAQRIPAETVLSTGADG